MKLSVKLFTVGFTLLVLITLTFTGQVIVNHMQGDPRGYEDAAKHGDLGCAMFGKLDADFVNGRCVVRK